MRPFTLSHRSELTQERLKMLVSYSPDTGEFVWVNPLRSFERGKVAGTVMADGRYVMIKVSSIGFLGHILAWLYMTGEFPTVELDHEDGNGLNNKWLNIRPATRSRNNQNRGVEKQPPRCPGCSYSQRKVLRESQIEQEKLRYSRLPHGRGSWSSSGSASPQAARRVRSR